MERGQSRRLPTEAGIQQRIENSRASQINKLVRHVTRILPTLEGIELLTPAEEVKAGLLVGYFHNGDERIPIPLGAVDQDGRVWEILSTTSMMTSHIDAQYTEPLAIPTRVIKPR